MGENTNQPITYANKSGCKFTWQNILLGLGLALLSATQLRLGSIPIGVGEVCIAVWLLLNVIYFFTKKPAWNKSYQL